MTQRFRYFVIFAEMRTGSNYLESNLNAFETLESHGEAFNPSFIGYPKREEILGVTLEQREENPMALLDKIVAEADKGVLSGFRYFSDHDPRVFDRIINDPECAKVILTRNPVDSYVSWRIAQNTGQWKLTNVKRRKDGTMHFDGSDFETYLSKLQEQQILLQNQLQKTGQTAFYIAYDDINDLEILNGLARFLGTDEKRDTLDDKLKRQNPSPLSTKVENYSEMLEYLSGYDRFDLTRTPNFEPRRRAMIPTMIVGAKAPLLFMPVPSAPYEEVCDWMAALDHVENSDLQRRLNQNKLRNWIAKHPDHAKFTIVSHPVQRAHTAFCHKILPKDDNAFPVIRKRLRNFYKLPLPGDPERNYSIEDHTAAFKAFLKFLEQNLNGQTSIRVDGNWATQFAVLQGMSAFTLPDEIIREDDMVEKLGGLANSLGYPTAPPPYVTPKEKFFALSDIYDEEIEELAKNVYEQDYLMFGFKRWR